MPVYPEVSTESISEFVFPTPERTQDGYYIYTFCSDVYDSFFQRSTSSRSWRSIFLMILALYFRYQLLHQPHQINSTFYILLIYILFLIGFFSFFSSLVLYDKRFDKQEKVTVLEKKITIGGGFFRARASTTLHFTMRGVNEKRKKRWMRISREMYHAVHEGAHVEVSSNPWERNVKELKMILSHPLSPKSISDVRKDETEAIKKELSFKM